jgi:hypothetical protein
MSDAKVEFGRLDGSEGPEQTFSFQCPKHNRRCGDLIIAGRTDTKRDGQNRNGGTAQWDWLNAPNREAPTFSPSINCGGCWHGYIQNGRCVDTMRKDEPEIVKLPR